MRIASLTAAFALAMAVFADEPRKADPLTANSANELKQQYERQLKEFADSIEKVKDIPEAKEALEKARDEFKKAMAEKLKEAEKALPPDRGDGPAIVPPVRIERIPPIRGERIPRPVFPERQPLFPDDLQGLQQELLKEQMDVLRAFQALNGANRSGGRLGLRLEPVPAVLVEQMGLDKNVGVVVGSVVQGSAAEKAGVKVNDVLLQVQGKDVPADTADAVALFARAKEGDKLDLLVLRKGKKEKIEGLVVPAEARPEVPVPVPGRINKGFQMSIVNDVATLSGKFDGGVEITVTGPIKGNTVEPTKIVIKEGDTSIELESLEKVPEKYRGQVEKLLNFSGARRGDRER